MKSKIIIMILTLTLFSTIFVQNMNPNNILMVSERSAEENLNMPLFEKSSPFWKDYSTNQAIQNAFKWGSVSSVVAVQVQLEFFKRCVAERF